MTCLRPHSQQGWDSSQAQLSSLQVPTGASVGVTRGRAHVHSRFSGSGVGLTSQSSPAEGALCGPLVSLSCTPGELAQMISPAFHFQSWMGGRPEPLPQETQEGPLCVDSIWPDT